MDVNIRYISFDNMPQDLCEHLLDIAWTVTTPAKSELGPNEWVVIDKWFKDNYDAVPHDKTLNYYFYNPEKYAEFVLRWM